MPDKSLSRNYSRRIAPDELLPTNCSRRIAPDELHSQKLTEIALDKKSDRNKISWAFAPVSNAHEKFLINIKSKASNFRAWKPERPLLRSNAKWVWDFFKRSSWANATAAGVFHNTKRRIRILMIKGQNASALRQVKTPQQLTGMLSLLMRSLKEIE